MNYVWFWEPQHEHRVQYVVVRQGAVLHFCECGAVRVGRSGKWTL
jgi:hypothetical protein